MLKVKYVKIVTNILHLFNYNKIENVNGSNHILLNVVDLILAFAYALLSVCKLDTVTRLVLIMNFLTLSRLIVGNFKNSIILRDKYEEKYLKRPGLLFKSAYDYKLIVELCVIAFTLIPFWIQGVILEEHIIRGFAGIIIILGFLENLINVFAELFKVSVDIEKIQIN